MKLVAVTSDTISTRLKASLTAGAMSERNSAALGAERQTAAGSFASACARWLKTNSTPPPFR